MRVRVLAAHWGDCGPVICRREQVRAPSSCSRSSERGEKANVAIASNESFSKAHMFAAAGARQRLNLTSADGAAD